MYKPVKSPERHLARSYFARIFQLSRSLSLDETKQAREMCNRDVSVVEHYKSLGDIPSGDLSVNLGKES